MIIDPTSLHVLVRNGSEHAVLHHLTGLCKKYHYENLTSELEGAFCFSARRPHNRVVDFLLQKGMNPDSMGPSVPDTPLFRALWDGNYELARLLLEYGADPRHRTKIGRGKSSLHLVAGKGPPEIAALLLNKGADMNEKISTGLTPLAYAIGGGKSQMVKFLVDEGAELNTGRCTIFCQATHTESVDVLRVLLDDAGMSIEDPHSDGLTPLQLMAREGYEKAVRFLLDRGANIAAGTNSSHGTALHLAGAYRISEQAPLSLVKLLIERGADIKSRNFSGETPLHTAAFRGSASVVQLLLDLGADLEAKDDHAQTALHKAAQQTREDVVGVLLDSGALTEGRDKWDGSTALQIAEGRGHRKVVRLLLDHGKRTTPGQWFHNMLPRWTFR